MNDDPFLEGNETDTLQVYARGLDALEFLLYQKGQNKTQLRAVIRAIREKAMYTQWPNLKPMLERLNGETGAST